MESESTCTGLAQGPGVRCLQPSSPPRPRAPDSWPRSLFRPPGNHRATFAWFRAPLRCQHPVLAARPQAESARDLPPAEPAPGDSLLMAVRHKLRPDLPPPTAAGGNYDLGGGVKGAALGGPARRPALCRPGTRCPPQRHPGSECRPGQAPGLNCREPAKEAKPEFLDKAFPHAWLGTRACNSKRLGFDSRLRIKSTTRGQKPTGPVPPALGPQPTPRLGPCVATDDSRCFAAARGPGAASEDTGPTH